MYLSNDVLIFGEALVDFLPEHAGPLATVARFERQLGGAPANLAIGLARLGSRAKLLTRVGRDAFGDFLVAALKAQHVDVSEVRRAPQGVKTGITFVSVSEDGDRSFLFFREPSADLTVEHADYAQTALDAPILHLGSNLMVYEQGRETTLMLARRAREQGVLVSMDVNLRPHLWADPSQAAPTIRELLPYVNLLKASKEEAEALVGGARIPAEIYAKLADLGVRCMALTCGADGAWWFTPSGAFHQPASTVQVVDTTGAGDGFWAGVLHGVCELHGQETNESSGSDWLARIDQDAWKPVLRLATFVGGRVCERMGATTGMPHAAEVPWADLGWPLGRLVPHPDVR